MKYLSPFIKYYYDNDKINNVEYKLYTLEHKLGGFECAYIVYQRADKTWSHTLNYAGMCIKSINEAKISLEIALNNKGYKILTLEKYNKLKLLQ